MSSPQQKFNREQLAEMLKRECEKKGVSPQMQQQMLQQLLNNKLPPNRILDELVTADEKMIVVKEKVDKLTHKDINVLIVGETGTGKEILARALHNGKQGRFVDVNCAGIPDSLFESEFFGVTKGAFTGCTSTREGYFEQAQNGTIFLDEIAEIPYEIQGKLLRVLETRQLRKVGGTEMCNINCRIVAATNDLNLHTSNKFRKDLYYRLSGSKVETTPLSKRRGDIRLIVDHWDKDDKIPVQLIELWVNDMVTFPFEGNVRELKNLVNEYICLNT
jgi:transcriptional regulator with PAS, ATPase and Fis domain